MGKFHWAVLLLARNSEPAPVGYKAMSTLRVVREGICLRLAGKILPQSNTLNFLAKASVKMKKA
jgi:hypothetical protein